MLLILGIFYPSSLQSFSLTSSSQPTLAQDVKTTTFSTSTTTCYSSLGRTLRLLQHLRSRNRERSRMTTGTVPLRVHRGGCEPCSSSSSPSGLVSESKNDGGGRQTRTVIVSTCPALQRSLSLYPESHLIITTSGRQSTTWTLLWR